MERSCWPTTVDVQVAIELPHLSDTLACKKFLLSLYQELSVTRFLDVMVGTVKRDYRRSLPCVWKAFIVCHNHKQDFYLMR